MDVIVEMAAQMGQNFWSRMPEPRRPWAALADLKNVENGHFDRRGHFQSA